MYNDPKYIAGEAFTITTPYIGQYGKLADYYETMEERRMVRVGPCPPQISVGILLFTITVVRITLITLPNTELSALVSLYSKYIHSK